MSLVRNGVKLQLTLAKVDADIADIKSKVSNDNYEIIVLVLTLCYLRFMSFVVKIRELPSPERKLMSEVISVCKLIWLILVNPVASASVERSFSTAQGLETWFRSTTTQERLPT